jgi:hypothetical protein
VGYCPRAGSTQRSHVPLWPPVLRRPHQTDTPIHLIESGQVAGGKHRLKFEVGDEHGRPLVGGKQRADVSEVAGPGDAAGQKIRRLGGERGNDVVLVEPGEVARQVDQVQVAGPALREPAKMCVDGVPVPLPEPTGIDHGSGESGGGPRVPSRLSRSAASWLSRVRSTSRPARRPRPPVGRGALTGGSSIRTSSRPRPRNPGSISAAATPSAGHSRPALSDPLGAARTRPCPMSNTQAGLSLRQIAELTDRSFSAVRRILDTC